MAGGYKSLTASWLGGAAAPGSGDGYTSLLAFWIGGASGYVATTPPVDPPSGGGGVLLPPIRRQRRSLVITTAAVTLSIITHSASVTIATATERPEPAQITVRTGSVQIDNHRRITTSPVAVRVSTGFAAVSVDSSVDITPVGITVSVGSAEAHTSREIVTEPRLLTVSTGFATLSWLRGAVQTPQQLSRREMRLIQTRQRTDVRDMVKLARAVDPLMVELINADSV